MFFSYRLPLAIAAAAFSLSLVPASMMSAAEEKPKPEQLKELDRLVGEWTTEAKVSVMNGEPKDLKSTGNASRKWALDGYIIEETGKSSDGNEARVIFTYDRAKRSYRWFFFNSSGAVVDMAGEWDAAKNTFNFKCDLGNGSTQAATIHFLDADHHEWTSKVTDPAGKVMFEFSGKLTRKK